jgi:hypothetical protein
VTTVRIAHIVPRPGAYPDGSFRISKFLIVLADADATADVAAGRRALSLFLQVPGGDSLWRLLERPAADPVMAGVLEETAALLLDAAGVTVTGVDLQVISQDAVELCSRDVTARVELGTASGTRHVMLSAGYGLALAVASGAPVRLADAVLDRLAVRVQDGDLLTPFIPPAAARRLARRAQRWRFEPRNLAFSDGLDRWELFGDEGQSHLQDYSCAAGSRSVTLASGVQEPHGTAVLVQTIFADDYRGRTVTFRGELRTHDVVGHAGLHLAAGRLDEPPGAHLYSRGASSLTAPGSSDWTRHEVTAQVSDAEVVRFGVSLTGRGSVELRNAELTAGA